MSSTNNSYRNITKAFSIFGGVQVVTILILLVRSKFVALYLGPSGLGISSLYNSTLSILVAITGLGISFSAVKDIAAANATEDKLITSETIIVFRKWVWFTGILGAIITLAFAKTLGTWTFGNTLYTWSFVFLSITILLTAYSNGQKTILQGLSKLKKMANMTIWGSIFGLVTLPLYYFYGQNGIVPAIIISAIISAIISWFFSKDIKVESIKISNRKVYHQGLSMVKLGLLVTLSGYFYLLGTYILNIFINKMNGPTDVGLYQAGWMITNQAVGLVFTAMSVDYFPRLAAINSDNFKIKELVNQQAEIILLIMGVLIVLLIIFVPFAIKLLLTNSFLSISNFVRLTSLGILFKAVHWCLGYVILVKGDTKLYMICELTGTSIMFLSYMAGYYLFGVDGIGFAFIFSYIFYIVLYYLIIYNSYKFSFNKSFIELYLIIITISLSVYIVSLLFNGVLFIILESILSVLIISYSYNELNKRLLIKDMISKFIQNRIIK